MLVDYWCETTHASLVCWTWACRLHDGDQNSIVDLPGRAEMENGKAVSDDDDGHVLQM